MDTASTCSGIYDEKTVAAVTAFQSHFRPARVDGLADLSTRATLRDLLSAAARSCSRRGRP